MPTLIEFLAQLGQDSRLSRASHEDLQVAMKQAGLPAAARDAVLQADRHAIESQAGATTNTCCIIFPGDDGDDEGNLPFARRAA